MTIPLAPVDPVQTTAVGQRILDAASTLFYERGITATGVDLIVEQAGTTKRTLYQRFGSKTPSPPPTCNNAPTPGNANF